MYLVLDFGGTNIKGGLMEKGEFSDFFSVPSCSEQGMGQALFRIHELMREKKADRRIEYVGIATPGVVDSRRNRILSINEKFADGTRIDFESWCRQAFSAPLLMENDANAALYGEISRGCARGVENAVMMTLGTGIGTAAVIEGRLLKGVHYQAGILGGHFVADIWGKPCSCGGRGCLETLGGSRELAVWVPELDGFLESRLADEPVIDMKAVIACMKAEDRFSRLVFDRVVDIYSAGVINMIHAYDPEVVILSGGIMQSRELILPRMKEIVEERAWTPWGAVEWRVAENPNQSVLYGLNAWIEEKIKHE